MKAYWADLHNHNEVGYGEGSLERSYAIARGSLLDVYAFTPHGFWPDLPVNDPKLAEYHHRGFHEKVLPSWDRVRAMADSENRDSAFVALPAFEWHSSRYGDYHLLFPDANHPICEAKDVRELQDYTRSTGAVAVPHHIAYAKGWRGMDWNSFDPSVSPVVDVFSEHGNGMESAGLFPYTLHSMGGSELSQTALEQLKQGRVFGVVASTDNHHGHPACYGEGLAGILAESLTRKGVLDALRKRHAFAVTGDRITLEWEAGDGMMGDCLPASKPRRFKFGVKGLAALESVQILKNGNVAGRFFPRSPGYEASRFFVRVEFGWDSMKTKEVTDWAVKVNVSGGMLKGVYPGFAGGAGSVEKINRIVGWNVNSAEWSAFTSRLNSRPTSQVTVEIEGSPKTLVEVEAGTVYRGKLAGCRVRGSVGGLLRQEEWGAIADPFSAPRLRLGQVASEAESSLSGEWSDPAPGERDWYLLKAVQKNGQTAWSSPIWFGVEPSPPKHN